MITSPKRRCTYGYERGCSGPRHLNATQRAMFTRHIFSSDHLSSVVTDALTEFEWSSSSETSASSFSVFGGHASTLPFGHWIYPTAVPGT